MRHVITIARRDLSAMFSSLRGYVVLSMLLLLFGVFFYFHLRSSDEATLREMFSAMNFLFLFVLPLLTMGSLSEEKRDGTMDLLLTCPVSRTEVVLGKFVACSTFYTIAVLITLEFVALIHLGGTPDPGPILTGYVGLLLAGYLGIAVGIYTSSLTRSPLVAALMSYALLLSAWILSAVPPYLADDVGLWVKRLGVVDHLASFDRGLLSMRDMLYFLMAIPCWLTFTVIGSHLERESPAA